MKCLYIHTDGGARGNPGPAGIGVLIRDEAGEVVDEIAKFLGDATNNQAEYQALLVGLERALALGAGEVSVASDSELLVRQIEGRYKVKNAGLKPLFIKAKDLLAQFDRYTIKPVRRELNTEADALVNQAIDAHIVL